MKEKQAHGRLFLRYRDHGDLEAFGQLLEEFEGPLYAYMMRFLRNPSEAEDALQEVWLKAIRRAESYHDRGQFSSWIYRIAHNHCLDLIRRNGRVVALDTETEQSQPGCWPSASEEMARSPFENLEERELVEYLEKAVATLSPAMREVFVLRTSADLSFREISEVLECPIGTVLGRMHLAVQKIRKQFEEMGLAPPDGENAATSAIENAS
ncbi:MAG TPA: sigma-70 family RNA polymerase sigma factor [bacterium]|nr:sigma-70 family RNA polymerase sigma factor [bacterium]HPO07139.1 sigma-70 family RNA polymerase sigma factor [bacterium]HQP98996.1 sigma-70 family RNA polymerase sigma factor [bacterium]